MSAYKYDFICPKCAEELRYLRDTKTGEDIIVCSKCDFKETK